MRPLPCDLGLIFCVFGGEASFSASGERKDSTAGQRLHDSLIGGKKEKRRTEGERRLICA